MKPVVFLSRSLDAIRSFPDAARREAGYQLDRLQHRLEPTDWKPMPAIWPGKH
jgi:phage-related protein